jgi:signal transduction histidine kinase
LPAIAIQPGKHGTALYFALIAAGLAGNYLNYPIFLNINFLFGSLFAMLALQFFGFGRGVLAAALIASYTYVLWNEPYAMIIMTAEVAFVAWLMARRRMGMVVADTLYWIVIGMPLGYLFYKVVLNVSVDSAYIIMTKQAVNGIANALLARLAFTAVALRTRIVLTPYREIVYNLLVFFVLCPALIMLAVGSRRNFEETDTKIRTQLQQKSVSVTRRLETWVQNRTTAVVALATIAATLTPRDMQARLEQARASDVNFLRIGMRDTESVITAYAPPIDESGQSNVGKRFDERPYIQTLRRALKPMLAEIVTARIGPPTPAVILLAPVLRDGEYSGYVNSVLSLEQIRTHLENSSGRDATLYTLVDRNRKVILSNRKDQAQMSPYERGDGELIRIDANISQWIPGVLPNTSISERWKDSFYVAESGIGDVPEWSLILEQPVAPFQKTLYENYANQLVMLFFILLGALALAEFLSRRVVAATEELSRITQHLPDTLAAGGKTSWPQTAILEADRLIRNFSEMAQTLAEQFQANRQLNETLERRVEERTGALETSIAELKRSNADLEQFAYAASHDMRQPLRMISSYLQLLEAELAPVLTDETRQNLAFATEGAQRMDQMLGALLDYSRIGRGGEAMVAMDSREAVDEALSYFQPQIAQAGAEVRIEGDWPRIFANRDQMRRLLQNLIDNALKYRLEGRVPQILISAQASAGEWRVSVRDNGIGLLPGQEARLFKVFERLQPRSRYPGTGIGLALCRKIVEHHDGCIRVESSGENQGCAFIFSLPMSIIDESGATASSRTTSTQRSGI